ncbi:MAG: hypothetical protein HOY71_46895 [Nonomuraea sp.]|nr:hypothetical protein [Nonomuraea sp.]
MNAMIRAALVGAVVGLAQVLIHLFGPRDMVGNELLMLFAPFPLGLALSWFGMLRRWGLVALFGQLAVMILHIGMIFTVPMSVVMEFGAWQGGLVLMLAGACGYSMGAGLAMPVNTALRVSAVGVAASLVLAAWSNQTVIGYASVAKATAEAGLPLLAPDIPGFHLEKATLQDGTLHLWYTRPSYSATVMAEVRPKTSYPEEACRDDLSNFRGKCRAVSPGVWSLHREIGRTLYASHENALLVVNGESMWEGDLLAVLSSFRPVNAMELAAD